MEEKVDGYEQQIKRLGLQSILVDELRPLAAPHGRFVSAVLRPDGVWLALRH